MQARCEVVHGSACVRPHRRANGTSFLFEQIFNIRRGVRRKLLELAGKPETCSTRRHKPRCGRSCLCDTFGRIGNLERFAARKMGAQLEKAGGVNPRLARLLLWITPAVGLQSFLDLLEEKFPANTRNRRHREYDSVRAIHERRASVAVRLYDLAPDIGHHHISGVFRRQ